MLQGFVGLFVLVCVVCFDWFVVFCCISLLWFGLFIFVWFVVWFAWLVVYCLWFFVYAGWFVVIIVGFDCCFVILLVVLFGLVGCWFVLELWVVVSGAVCECVLLFVWFLICLPVCYFDFDCGCSVCLCFALVFLWVFRFGDCLSCVLFLFCCVFVTCG